MGYPIKGNLKSRKLKQSFDLGNRPQNYQILSVSKATPFLDHQRKKKITKFSAKIVHFAVCSEKNSIEIMKLHQIMKLCAT